ncbi:hypothetical protein [Streptomyces sp. NPDC091215]|uniref:hypothetical protein n=1 Tax=Streptomyces sp. NPDC091215 TaxID=3155192 RepID=UPI0034466E81
MDRQDRTVIISSAVIAVGAFAFIAWPPGSLARGDAAGIAQSVTAVLAVTVALLIATQDRRRADRAAADDAAEARHTFLRRRQYDQYLRLVQLIESDRRSRSRSPEATALVLALQPNGTLGLAVDYYVQADRDPNNRFARAEPTEEEFVRMLKEVTDAIGYLDHQERL